QAAQQHLDHDYRVHRERDHRGQQRHDAQQQPVEDDGAFPGAVGPLAAPPADRAVRHDERLSSELRGPAAPQPGGPGRSRSARAQRASNCLCELITPVSKPARCRPPWKRACSILMQRSMTTSRPAASPSRATSSCHEPSCSHSVLAPTASVSASTVGRSSWRRNTSTRSGTTGSASSEGYAGRPRISLALGFTKYTSKSELESRYVLTK